MKTNIVILCIVALAAVAIVLPASMQQSANQIYQAGVYKEDVEGNLEEAIAAYRQIIKKFPTDGPVAAKAWLHIGLCYEKLGNREAQNAYEQLIKGYPNQKQEVAVARERLALLIEIKKEAPAPPIFRKIRILTKSDGDMRLSPNGQKISLVSDNKLWIMPLSGKLGPDIPGAPSELDTENVPVSWMAHAWSADGKWIAFNEENPTGTSSIYVVSTEGGKPKKIYENYRAERTVNYRISLSPNGKTLAFSSVDLKRKEQHIYTIPVDGGPPKQLIDAQAREPVFSPDGSMIAFVEDKNLGRAGGGLWVVSAQGGTPNKIADAVNATSPIWSPGGNMIAFLDDGDNENKINFISVGENGRSTGNRFASDAPDGYQEAWLLSGWSPGNRIGAVFTKPAETGLYTLPAKGGKAMQVAVGGGQPRWSPDGKQIYFIKGTNNKNSAWQGLEIASIPAEGGQSTTVPLRSVAQMYIPSFGVGNRVSPDGKRIVFSGRTQYDPINFLNNDIWILPVEGGVPKKLTETPEQSTDMYPCWSPDGKTIAFVRTRIPEKLVTNDYKADIYFVRTNGGEPTPLTAESDSVNFGPIDWSPDGKFLAYFSKGNYDSGPLDLRIISAQGGGKSRVIGSVEDVNPGSQFTWSPDSKRIAFDVPGDKIKIISIEDGSIAYIDRGLIHSNIGGRLDWSPDGERFVFFGGTGGSDEFLVMENFLPDLKPDESLLAKETGQITVRKVQTNYPGQGGLSPDGRYLSFTDWDGDGNLVMEDLKTGEKKLLTSNAEVPKAYAFWSAFSPDGTKIAYDWFREEEDICELHILDLDKGSSRTVLGKDAGFYREGVSWSHDQKHIATVIITGKQTEIGWVSTEDGTTRVLRTLGGNTAVLFPSPDDRYVAYSYDSMKDPSNSDIFLVSTDGSGKTIPLVEHPANDRVLGWIPGRDELLFLSDRSGTWDVWILPVKDDLPAGDPVRIYPNLGDIDPIGFSKAGTYFFQVYSRWNENYISDLDPETGKLVGSLTLLLTGWKSSPDWSPDGRRLAYIDFDNLRGEPFVPFGVLHIRDLENGEDRKIQCDPGVAAVHWSPDGESLLIRGFSYDASTDTGLYIIDAQSGKTRFVVGRPDSAIAMGEWSANGKGIYFFDKDSIILHDLETGRERKLLTKPGLAGPLTLSPDGELLAARIIDKEKGASLITLNVSNGMINKVATPGEIHGLDWFADGKYLLYLQRDEKGGTTLYRVPRQGGTPEKLWHTDKDVGRLRVHPDGKQLTFSEGKSESSVRVMAGLTQRH